MTDLEKAELLRDLELVAGILAPLATAMVHALQTGADPLAVLEKERVRDLLPETFQLALARRVERARRGLPPDAPPAAPSGG